MFLRGDARRKLCRRLVRPLRVPACLPAGPLPRPTVQSDAYIRDRESLGTAMAAWYDAARGEFGALAGRDMAHSRPKLRWVQATGPEARPAGSATDARLWRSCASRAREAAALVARRAQGAQEIVGRHAANLGKALARRGESIKYRVEKGKISNLELEETEAATLAFRVWSAAFADAMQRWDAEAFMSLIVPPPQACCGA